LNLLVLFAKFMSTILGITNRPTLY